MWEYSFHHGIVFPWGANPIHSILALQRALRVPGLHMYLDLGRTLIKLVPPMGDESSAAFLWAGSD